MATAGQTDYYSVFRMNVRSTSSAQNTANSSCRAASMRLVLTAGLLGCVMLIAAGCESDRMADKPDLLNARVDNYATNLLQEGDIVGVSFQYSTNFDAVQKISLDGMLNLASVPPVKAAGKTVVELQTELARLYKPQIKDDVVTVKLASSANSVYLSGAVIRPGKIPLERPMTALEAIMEAGGFDPNRAKLSEVTVLRLEDGKQKVYRLNLKEALRGEDEEPFYLKPFDIVHVPTKTFNF
jgi:polysaccharide export outer membrane protein